MSTIELLRLPFIARLKQEWMTRKTGTPEINGNANQPTVEDQLRLRGETNIGAKLSIGCLPNLDLVTLVLLLVVCAGCRAHFLVVPAAPHYLLKSPDGEKRAFPDTTSSFSNAIDGWVDLGPHMTLKLEKAYFMPPESRRIQDYLGLETAQYRYESNGSLRLSDYVPLRTRPSHQPPVTSALPADQLLSRYHRLFFQVVLSKESGPARAIILSGDSKPTVATVAARLLRGDGCPDSSQTWVHCTAIPEAISVSLSFDILANGSPLPVSWGSTVAGVVGAKRPVKLSRVFRGRMVRVELDPLDPSALRIPLLPGDVLIFGPE